MSSRDKTRASFQKKDLLMSERADLPKQTAIQSGGVSSFGDAQEQGGQISPRSGGIHVT